MNPSTCEPGFGAIGKGIYFFRPRNAGVVDSSHPTLIMLFGWMGAKLPHLQKYTSAYHKRYPNTTIILIRSEPSFFWSTEYQQLKSLAPVIDALESIGCIEPSRQPRGRISQPSVPLGQHRVLVHTFSNGGCFQLTTLGRLFSRRQVVSASSSTTFTASAIVLDSCPGHANFSAAQRAFASVITNPIGRFLAKFMVTILLCIELVVKHILRRQAYFTTMKSSLNKANVLPWTGKSTPRLYIYSEGDELVEAGAVEQHMEEGRGKGLSVSAEKFGKESKHVCHARTDPERYWAAVGRLWKEALEMGMKEA